MPSPPSHRKEAPSGSAFPRGWALSGPSPLAYHCPSSPPFLYLLCFLHQRIFKNLAFCLLPENKASHSHLAASSGPQLLFHLASLLSFQLCVRVSSSFSRWPCHLVPPWSQCACTVLARPLLCPRATACWPPVHCRVEAWLEGWGPTRPWTKQPHKICFPNIAAQI